MQSERMAVSLIAGTEKNNYFFLGQTCVSKFHRPDFASEMENLPVKAYPIFDVWHNRCIGSERFQTLDISYIVFSKEILKKKLYFLFFSIAESD